MVKIVAKNKKAFFDYQINEKYEAGLVLLGPEIKAIRAGRVNITGSYVKKMSGDSALWWIGGQLDTTSADSTRSRQLLLHQQELRRLIAKLEQGNSTIVPLELILRRGLAKLVIGLATRRQAKDKRALLKKRDIDRQLSKELKSKPAR